LGRKITLRDDWENIKNNVMYSILFAKFNQNKNLMDKLMKTYPSVLIEGNYWHDDYWGDCYCHKHRYVRGNNILGKMLMKLREEFINRICS